MSPVRKGRKYPRSKPGYVWGRPREPKETEFTRRMERINPMTVKRSEPSPGSFVKIDFMDLGEVTAGEASRMVATILQKLGSEKSKRNKSYNNKESVIGTVTAVDPKTGEEYKHPVKIGFDVEAYEAMDMLAQLIHAIPGNMEEDSLSKQELIDTLLHMFDEYYKDQLYDALELLGYYAKEKEEDSEDWSVFTFVLPSTFKYLDFAPEKNKALYQLILEHIMNTPEDKLDKELAWVREYLESMDRKAEPLLEALIKLFDKVGKVTVLKTVIEDPSELYPGNPMFVSDAVTSEVLLVRFYLPAVKPPDEILSEKGDELGKEISEDQGELLSFKGIIELVDPLVDLASLRRKMDKLLERQLILQQQLNEGKKKNRKNDRKRLKQLKKEFDQISTRLKLLSKLYNISSQTIDTLEKIKEETRSRKKQKLRGTVKINKIKETFTPYTDNERVLIDKDHHLVFSENVDDIFEIFPMLEPYKILTIDPSLFKKLLQAMKSEDMIVVGASTYSPSLLLKVFYYTPNIQHIYTMKWKDKKINVGDTTPLLVQAKEGWFVVVPSEIEIEEEDES